MARHVPNIRRRGNKYQIRFMHGGKRCSETYDSVEDAELALRRRQLEAVEVERGIRGIRERNHTFGEACDLWLQTRAKGKRSGAKDESAIRLYLAPAFGTRMLRSVTAPAW